MLTVATPLLVDDHVAHGVRSWSVLSDKVPVAEKVRVVPGAILAGAVGFNPIETTEATVNVMEAERLPEVAMMVQVPGVNVAVTSPWVPEMLLTVAIPVLDELQVTLVVTGKKDWLE